MHPKTSYLINILKSNTLTGRPTVKLNKAISFFPALREMGFLNVYGKCVPFPVAVPIRQEVENKRKKTNNNNNNNICIVR